MRIFWRIMWVFCIVATGFLTWRDEHHRAERAEAALSAMTARYDAAKDTHKAVAVYEYTDSITIDLVMPSVPAETPIRIISNGVPIGQTTIQHLLEMAYREKPLVFAETR